MKRSQDLSPLAVEQGPSSAFPAPKKFKAAPRISHGISIPASEHSSSAAMENGDNEWKKVEKRKAKKAKKAEARMEVCVPTRFHILAELSVTQAASPPQTNAPRFLYAKGEIVKRKEAVGISVRRVHAMQRILIDLSLQDIRELVLHLSADAPPPSWVRVEVCMRSSNGLLRRNLRAPPEPAICTESCSATHPGHNSRDHLASASSNLCYSES